LERAAQIERFNPGTHYRLGVVYRELGRADDSHREMTRFEELKQMKSRLGDLYQDPKRRPPTKSKRAAGFDISDHLGLLLLLLLGVPVSRKDQDQSIASESQLVASTL
jgi:hypothetical protein